MPTSNDNAIALQNVAKIYRGSVHALRGISMNVRRGEIFGLLGPNGAGKTTLVKIMMTVVRPTFAAGSILDHPIGHRATLRRIGYLPESHRFPRYLTGRRVVEFFSALSRVDRRTRKRRSVELLEAVGMTDWMDRRISEYSKGMAQRTGLAAALAADPDLLVLDEPTDGVDPGGRKDIRDLLLKLRAQGKTVFINSHLLSELEIVCDRIAILVSGVVARQGTIDELTVGKQFFLFELWADADLSGKIRDALPGVFADPANLHGKLPDGTLCELDGALLKIGTTDPLDVQSIVDALRGRNIVIRRMHPVRPSLEELFFDAVRQVEAPNPPGGLA